MVSGRDCCPPGAAPGARMETATINLLWHPQAQFAGYLVAERLDLGRPYGVRLETTPLEFGVGPVNSVLSGPAHSAWRVPPTSSSTRRTPWRCCS